MVNATVLADSISPDGVRLTSLELVYPRFFHSELMTHRMLSRNAASSRAVPVLKMIDKVRDNPAQPSHWGRNQSGMQARQELEGSELERAKATWALILDQSLAAAVSLAEVGAHKQFANRITEPYQHITVLISATEWDNFFALRAHPDAQPEFQQLAVLARQAMQDSIPLSLGYDEWHLPLVIDEEREAYPHLDWLKVSAGRCCRISYLTHDGIRDPQADITLYEQLVADGHMSPLEHVARPFSAAEWQARRELQLQAEKIPGLDDLARAQIIDSLGFNGNLRGWTQLRKTIAGEHDFSQVR